METPRVLVVEDDRDIAELVRYNLEAGGFAVSVVGDGRPALHELARNRVDLLVLDLMLPAVSGLEVCKAIRNDPELWQMPILIMTARGEESIRSLAFAMGATDYIVKPFQPCELVTRVRAILSRSVEAAVGSSGPA